MVKITVASVDRCELETELMNKKDTKYIVLYPTYEALKPSDANEEIDYSVGSTFITSAGSNDVCTNLCGVLAEGGFIQSYFSFRAILASAASYCRSKKISTVIIPACMLTEIVSEDINTSMINSAIKEIFGLAGINCNIIITTVMTKDDEVILGDIGMARAHANRRIGFDIDKQAKKAIAKKNKKGEKKSKKGKKKKNKKRK